MNDIISFRRRPGEQREQIETVLGDYLARLLIENGFQRRIAELTANHIGLRVRQLLDDFEREVTEAGGSVPIQVVMQLAADVAVAACVLLAQSDRL